MPGGIRSNRERSHTSALLAISVSGMRRFLNEEPPVEIGRGQIVRHAMQHFVGRNDVENGELGDAVRVIEGHAVRDASAAIVADERELLKSQAGHQFHLVLRHRALGIVQVVFAVGEVCCCLRIRGDRPPRR